MDCDPKCENECTNPFGLFRRMTWRHFISVNCRSTDQSDLAVIAAVQRSRPPFVLAAARNSVLRIWVGQPYGLIHHVAVSSLLGRQPHDRIMEMSWNSQCAMRRFLNPFPPPIECVFGHFRTLTGRSRRPIALVLQVDWPPI